MTGPMERLVKGRISLHARGFGFLRTEPGAGGAGPTATPASIFLPPPELSGFLAGDLVEGTLVEGADGEMKRETIRL